jgi:hypothetical protein
MPFQNGKKAFAKPVQHGDIIRIDKYGLAGAAQKLPCRGNMFLKLGDLKR